MTMLHAISVIVFCGTIFSSLAAGESVFYVSPRGNDTHGGTKEAPFRTIERAREEVRRTVATGLRGPVTVLLRGGVYELSAPLTFGPQDSGTEEHSITYAAYPDEKVAVSGGRVIRGWKRGEGQLWTAEVPGVREGKWRFRHLFVNGRRATRARTPNKDAKTPYVLLQDALLSGDLKSFIFRFPLGALENWKNQADIEVITIGIWGINRKRVESLDAQTGKVTLAPPHSPLVSQNSPKRGQSCFFENAREFLDQPGEWHLDRATGVLTYWPLPGENMVQAEAIAPAITHLLVVSGTQKNPVRNLHFRAIRFEHTDWELPATGYLECQACVFPTGRLWYGPRDRVDAAIQWNYVDSSSLTACSLSHLGGGGIELVKGCSRNRIERNHIFDVSANGVMVGDPGPKVDPLDVPKGNRIANNHIHSCGTDFYGAIGIWVGITEGTLITHNLVHDLPYTGISVGWQWNADPTPCKANIIEYNHVHDTVKRLRDGGGIYTLGFQPGTTIRGNLIRDISAGRRDGSINGLYLDEGSNGFLIESNVIFSTAGAPVRHNRNSPAGHTWKDNFFGDNEARREGARQIIDTAGLKGRDRDRQAVNAFRP
jgi:hypothetical protein